MSRLDDAMMLMLGRAQAFSASSIGAYDSSANVRIGTAAEDSAAGRVLVVLDGSSEAIALACEIEIKKGDRVRVISSGGTYVVVALAGMSDQIDGVERELIDFADALGDLGNQIDGKVETWFYAYEPSPSNEPASTWATAELKQHHAGDLFFNTSTGYAYRWTGAAWQPITDDRIQQALAAASAAEDAADSKRRVFTAQPYGPYDRGDLWVTNTSGTGDLKVCKTAEPNDGRFYASDWVNATKYTDDQAIENVVDTFMMTRSVATVYKQRQGTSTGTVTTPSVDTTYWWVFKPTNAPDAPTIAFASIPLSNVSTRRALGGATNYISDYTFQIAWPAAIGSLSLSNLPICLVSASAHGDFCNALVYNRDTSYLGPIAVNRPYDTNEAISSVRIEIMVVTRR